MLRQAAPLPTRNPELSLPPAHKAIGRSCPRAAISKQNLSDWRQGGYAEWLLKEELSEQASALQNQAEAITDASSPLLADNLLTVFIVRYSSLVTHWNGKVTRSFDARLKLFTRMRRDLMKLQEGAQIVARNRCELEERDAKMRRDIDQQAAEYAMAPMRAAMLRATSGENSAKKRATHWRAC